MTLLLIFMAVFFSSATAAEDEHSAGTVEEYDPEFIDGYIDMIFTNDVTRLLLNEHKCKKNADFLIDIHMKKDPALPHDVLMEVSCDGKTGWIHVVGNPPDMASFSAEKPANYIDD